MGLWYPETRVLRVWDLCRAESGLFPSAVLGSVCMLAVKTHVAVLASLHTFLQVLGPSCHQQEKVRNQAAHIRPGIVVVLTLAEHKHFHKYSCLDRETKLSLQLDTNVSTK